MIEAALKLMEPCEAGDYDKVIARWRELLKARGWDGDDARCRLDSL